MKEILDDLCVAYL